ncbi:MAG: hypothetical protein ACLTV6_06370 [Christensenellales bacterium]
MAGGQQTLKTIVVLSGRVDNSFGIIGSELTQLGNKVNGVSSQLAQYGEESLNVYKNYEDGIWKRAACWPGNTVQRRAEQGHEQP